MVDNLNKSNSHTENSKYYVSVGGNLSQYPVNMNQAQILTGMPPIMGERAVRKMS